MEIYHKIANSKPGVVTTIKTLGDLAYYLGDPNMRELYEDVMIDRVSRKKVL